jgi:A/G-specific adenine glycosylase
MRSIRTQLDRWYRTHRRDLPWRPPTGRDDEPVDPYHVLVSEFMLQQTQVSTVVSYFKRFIASFPDVRSLATADEQDVLMHWEGLGYYRRARMLHACARAIVEQHQAIIPSDPETLLTLPGIGQYTAGAIASIGFARRAPIVDGNVSRILSRIECLDIDTQSTAGQHAIWAIAAQIVPQKSPGVFNSAMMELGATICTPKSPRCAECPVSKQCRARELDRVESIPRRRAKRPLPIVERVIYCLHDAKRDLWCLEQRPPNGRWAGMWQFPSRESDGPSKPIPGEASNFDVIGGFDHALTHRLYRFKVVAAPRSRATQAILDPSRPTTWLSLDDSRSLPMPVPHLRVREMLLAR